ncbi:hypothetical protein E2C01_079472 [Portunus trituberculatus]|uniref:Uncharacterized protein n=1 Tax=Portunus trituberculatus TaxID=210409 RepID=A0A5B7IWZ2_PORTR|nr:hypothetical protein [Portunus trituberculatus]
MCPRASTAPCTTGTAPSLSAVTAPAWRPP